MAEFVTVIKEKDRMCKCFEQCRDCPLGNIQGPFVLCRNWIIEHPKEAEKIILNWSIENPVTTNRMKLKEVFGFDVAPMFEVTSGNCAWLNSEYKNKEG